MLNAQFQAYLLENSRETYEARSAEPNLPTTVKLLLCQCLLLLRIMLPLT